MIRKINAKLYLNIDTGLLVHVSERVDGGKLVAIQTPGGHVQHVLDHDDVTDASDILRDLEYLARRDEWSDVRFRPAQECPVISFTLAPEVVPDCAAIQD